MDANIYECMTQVANQLWWFRGRRFGIGLLLKQYLDEVSTERRVLSVGSGHRSELEFLTRYGRVIGIDKDKDVVGRLHGIEGVEELYHASVEKMPFEDSMFDAIFILDVLEHVEDDKSGMRELRRVLKPGGILVVTVPAFQWLWTRADEQLHHFRRYRKKTLLRLFAESDFEPMRVTYFNTFLFPPIAFLKILFRWWKPKGLVDHEVPRLWINRILEKIFRAEFYCTSKVDFPFGVSLFAVARKDSHLS